MIIKGKKGFYFTAVVLMLISLVVLASEISKHDKSTKITSLDQRITEVNKFIIDLQSDATNALYIASFRAVLGANEYITQYNRDYIPCDELNKDLFTLAYNGTINNESMSISDSSTILLWVEKIKSLGFASRFEISFSTVNISYYMIDTWTLKTEMNTSANISDINSLASWTIPIKTSITLDIRGFEDPLYIVATNGRFTNQVKETPFSNLVDCATNSTANLESHWKNQYYMASSSGPDFLMRHCGNLSASRFGIESLVYSKVLDGMGFVNTSVVDYIFFNKTLPPASGQWVLNEVFNISPWLLIDNLSDHLFIYGTCKLRNGANCTSFDQCLSGNCVHGVCRTGKTFCGDGYCDANETCTYDGSGLEVCNNLDDDCNGTIDLIIKPCLNSTYLDLCTKGNWFGCVSMEVCNGVDDDGDSIIDEGFTTDLDNPICKDACTYNNYNWNIARPGNHTCCGDDRFNASFMPREPSPAEYQSTEYCFDGFDNNCNGVENEGCGAGGGGGGSPILSILLKEGTPVG